MLGPDASEAAKEAQVFDVTERLKALGLWDARMSEDGRRTTWPMVGMNSSPMRVLPPVGTTPAGAEVTKSTSPQVMATTGVTIEPMVLSQQSSVPSGAESAARWGMLKEALGSGGELVSDAEGAAAGHSHAAREEAARKLITNHALVLKDCTNMTLRDVNDAGPLTQLSLLRVSPELTHARRAHTRGRRRLD